MSKLPDFFQSSNDNTLLGQLDFELGGLDEDEDLPIEEEIEADVFNDSNNDIKHLPTFFNDEDSQNDMFELSTSLLSTSININSNNNNNNVPKAETALTSIELLKATLMKPPQQQQQQPNPPPAAAQSFSFTSNTHISPAVSNKPPGLFTQHAPPPIAQPVQQPNYIPLQTGPRPPNTTNNQPALSFMSGPAPPPPPQPPQPTSSQGSSQPLPTFAPPRGILMSASNVRYFAYLKLSF